MFATGLAPVTRGKSLSNTVTFGTAVATFLLTGEDTGGNFSMVEMNMRPGTEPPYHIHEREDEAFYVIEGHMSVMVDGEVHECFAGQSIFLPRGLPHTFKVRSEVVKGLVMVTPSGFEKYFKRVGTPATSFEAPTMKDVSPDFSQTVGRIVPEFGIRIAPEQPKF